MPERVEKQQDGAEAAPPLHRFPLEPLQGPAAYTLIAILLLGGTAAVYLTGGTGYAVLHCMYIPIIVAGGLLRIPGGVITGIVAGLLIGPYMPLETARGVMQEPANWLVRLSFFATVGFVTGWITHVVRRQQAEVQRLAMESANTRLPNRLALLHTLSELARERSRDYTLALVHINNFDQIINVLGNGMADRTLRALADRLLDVEPGAQRVYHLDAHKLALLLPGSASGLEAYVRRTHELPDEPINISGIPIFLDLSVGTARMAAADDFAEALIRQANIALFEAHRKGRSHVAYRAEGEIVRRRNQELLAQLPNAILHSELFMEYQPKIELASGRALGVEALVRWQHPELGRIAPIEFIGPAESTALVHPLTRWVFRAAIADAAALRAKGHDLTVSINLSPRNLSDPKLFEHLLALLEGHGVPGARVELEITESAILHNAGHVRPQLEALRARGIRIAIDDFGTGYTSLSHLAELPIDCLKIDQSFVRDLVADPRRRAIVRSMVRLADELGVDTVAEGIEDEATAEEVIAIGCGIGQGYLYSRPLPIERIGEWLAERRAALA